MPLVIPAGYYEAGYRFSLSGSLHVSVVTEGWLYTGADIATDVPALADAFGLNMLSPIANVWQFLGMTLRDATGTLYDEPRNVQGGDAGAAMPPNVTYLLKKTTGVGGRKNRGRMYLPGVTEAAVDAVGNVLAAKQDEINSQIGGWIGAAAAANFSPYLLHNTPKVGVAPAPTLVSLVKTEPLIATQRNRLR